MAYTPTIKDFVKGEFICFSCGKRLVISGGGRQSDQQPPCPKCSAPLFPPFKIKTYWCFKPLGGGGMGSVYQALSEPDGKEYAIKMIPSWQPGGETFIENLRKEGEAGLAIGRHPHLVSVVEYGCDEDEHFMVMEFIKGERLDTLISAHGAMPELRAWEITLQLAEAVAHICSRGILFRDMKPENVIIEADGNVRLFDYGLCVPIDAQAGAESDDIEGSPFYLPPERIVGAAEGEHSEIYSLGMVLFHMLYGAPYYSEAEIGQLMVKHVSSLRFSSVGSRLKNCLPRSLEILDRMVARQPADRYHDFATLIPDITAHIEEVRKAASRNDARKYIKFVEEALAKFFTLVVKGKHAKRFQIMLAVLTVLFSIWLWRHLAYRAEERLKAGFRKEVAAKLGIPIDVKAPAKQNQQLTQEIAKRTTELQAELSAKLPAFDDAAARKTILDEWKVADIKPRPELPLDEVGLKLEGEIKSRVEELMTGRGKSFSADETADKIRRENSILPTTPKPTRAVNEIRAEIELQAVEAAEKKFTPESFNDAVTAVMGRYSAFKLGEKIQITLKSGKVIKGFYREFKGGTVVCIDKGQYQLKDISPNDALRFDEQQALNKINDEVRTLKDEVRKKKEKFKQEYSEKIDDKIYYKAGYFKVSPGVWGDSEAFVKAKVEEAKKTWEGSQQKDRDALRKEVEAKFDQTSFYTKFGYRKIEGKWMSEKDAMDKLIAERKKKYAAELEGKRVQVAKEAKEKAEQELYSANGYIKHNNQWMPARSVLDMLVLEKIYTSKK